MGRAEHYAPRTPNCGNDANCICGTSRRSLKRRVKLTRNSIADRSEAPLSRSQMLKTRRKKQKGKKRLAVVAKQAKKLGKQSMKVSADAREKGPL